jgi:hypothetical protein
MLRRRDFNRHLLTPPLAAAAAAAPLAACSGADEQQRYEASVRQIWRRGPLQGLHGAALSEELVRYATLAPSSHNTQCWRFALEADAITLHPDFTRRCPVVDPDDHHLYVSLGCAAENLVQAAQEHGLHAEAVYEPSRDRLRVALRPAPARTSPLFDAIPARQSTRGLYDSQPLAAQELKLLEQAASSAQVRLLLLSDKPSVETVLDFVIQGNSAQMADPAFVAELKQWLRFNEAEALAHGDGLFSRSSGNPTAPGWLARRLFDLVFRVGQENDKYARQLRSSAGVAVFVAAREDKAHWIELGRAYERFALQATALGIRNAHLNMPVEIASLRPRFADALGLSGMRPDLVIRFGRGPSLPPSLRRPLQAVLA